MSHAAAPEPAEPERAAPADLAATLAAIRSGPHGPGIAAFFDLDAVLDGFRRPWYRRLRGGNGVESTLLAGLRDGLTDGEYSRFLQQLSHTLAGLPEDEADELGTRLFRRTVYGHLYPEAWQLIRTHEAAGHTVVLTSALTRFQAEPVAAELGVDRVLCTTMSTEDGVLTGYPEGKTLWRNGKADAVRAFADSADVDLSASWAYGSDLADLPLLTLVGHPVTVNPERGLGAAADENAWTALSFRPRHAPRVLDYVRTVAGLAALLGGALFGVVAKSYTRQRRKMADALMAYGTGATLRVLGVRLRITGAEHARAPRPAVFLFNHQSQFDVIIVPKVLGGGVTGIGKKELTRNPIFGPLMRFVGVTFIDRSDTSRAKAALAPVVETLRGGLSIAISPEGTRSYTPEVGAFKKGAFHIAMQAGVPVIPVVIRNAGEISWRNSMVARRGTVDVAVLAPIDVSGWNPADLDDRVEQVRRLFLETLVEWPDSSIQ
ncbi:HAD-IB family hydrolase [Nocardia puris]|uniref:1-acyl-sn-glycerol-3-phosphate acyltransferase n=1 Tax=Nocardia puris TaxID=208602 RepID=A0A366DA52_9NOCA|nr:HAD-IB family hydrolase [Nocardia puris]MBF6211764.1 HAD-IB family hydrolase [Nocardia puris]MBF6365767.1 HAD-IB family hydrolase [Nocardia puris]MBF6460590.1 HAD-IB family hydrolase [Nocardia puris]RBO86942.1 putative phosphoserine phosphatase/1-acylglycerol-3-phosphate O-acyltransferase [Nocardia puris]